ncbi:MAG: PIN domain-containing protein [Bradyrhizobiaceae bacterium]|nr:PIN domain-containing protein [Bradyrhizobiaceae bacterium]
MDGREQPANPKGARRLIENAAAVYVSAASLWEMTIKTSAGKLGAPPTQDDLEAANFAQLAVSSEHAIRFHAIAVGHPDPFDWMLLAQAIVEPLYLLTTDDARRNTVIL